MTDATKASRSRTAQKPAGKGTAGTKRPADRTAEDIDVKAGEAAMRDATAMHKRSRRGKAPAGKSQKRAKARPEPAAKAARTAKAPGAAAPASRPAVRSQATRTKTEGATAWADPAGEWRDAALRAGRHLTETQLKALRGSAALGFKLIDLGIANARAQTEAAQAMTSAGNPVAAAEIQRKFAGECLSGAARQAEELRTLTADLLDSVYRSWTAFGGVRPGAKTGPGGRTAS